MEILRRRFLTATLCVPVLLPVGILSYRHLFHGRIIPVLIAAGFLVLYGLAAAASTWGMQEIQKYEAIRNARGILPEDHPKLLFCASVIPLPLHFCILLASLIPITTYEVWFVTIFPCIFITLQPIRAVCDVYQSFTYKKYRFWLIQLLIVLAAAVPAQIIVQTLA